MKILIFGDIYGRVGRKAFAKNIGELKEKYSPDFVLVNVDNATSGKGIIEKHAKYFENFGVDLMTSGDHIFDNFDKVKDYLFSTNSKIIIPANFYDKELQKKGFKLLEKNGKKLLVIHIMDETFMTHKVYNPFLRIEEILEKFNDEKLDGIVLDFHKEVSSSGYGIVHHFGDKISFVYGTHTHIQTNDDYIFDSGIGILSDVGMTGPINSVIGADFKTVQNRFLTGINKGKIEQSLDKKYILNAVCVEIDGGITKNIEKIKIIDKL